MHYINNGSSLLRVQYHSCCSAAAATLQPLLPFLQRLLLLLLLLTLTPDIHCDSAPIFKSLHNLMAAAATDSLQLQAPL
jgi:hypothetical protein